MQPPYRTAANLWFKEALFYERVNNMPIDMRESWPPPFSFNMDRPNCINVRKTFVELGDPTGYKWAIKYLGDYDHWKALMKSKWFVEAYENWLNELKVKIRSEALDTIRLIAKEGQPAQALVASKYLASFEWEKGTRGRPSKAEVQGELKRATALLAIENDDAERIGLRLVEKK